MSHVQLAKLPIPQEDGVPQKTVLESTPLKTRLSPTMYPQGLSLAVASLYVVVAVTVVLSDSMAI